MIKVCHIVSGDLWAGAEAMVSSLLIGLKRYPDVQLKVLLLNEGILSQKLRRDGFNPVVLDESRLGPVRLAQGASRLIRAARPAVIHAHRYKENFLAFLGSRGMPDTALVATQHGLIEKYGALSSLKQRLIHGANFALMARGFQKVVVVSHQMKAAMTAKNSFSAGKIAVIHNGIPIPDRSSPSKAARETLIIGSCGRLVPVKDFALMVEIARCVAAQTRKIRFQIAGDGPDKSFLAEMIRRHGLSDIFELLGHVDDMSAFYGSIDLFINTSIHEGIPMSVLEAMSHGRPVIAPEVGGFPEILNGARAGYLIPERRAADYAARCLALLEDTDLLLQMGRNARRRIETRFSMQAMAAEYHGLYKQLARNA